MAENAATVAFNPGVDTHTDVQWHFAVPVFTKFLGGFGERQSAFIQLLQQLHAEGPGLRKHNAYAWHSQENLHLLKNEHIAWLNQQIGAMAKECLIGRNPSATNFDIVMDACWGDVAGQGGWITPHNQYPAQWSGLFHVAVENTLNPHDADDKSSHVEFLNPIPIPGGFGLPGSIDYTPRDGQVILFPALLQHLVHPNMSPHARYTIGFTLNVIPRQNNRT